MNTPAMKSSTTGNKDIIKKSNEQEPPLGTGQESKEFDPGSMTISSASARSTSNLQLDEHQGSASGTPLLVHKGQKMLKSIIDNPQDFDKIREQRGLENVLARLDAQDSVNNPFATTSDEEWWLATAKKALNMEIDQLMREVDESIYSMTKMISERYNNKDKDPGTEAPEGRHQQKDATPTTSEEELTPPGATVRKRRNYQGDEISDGDGAGFKIQELISPLLKNDTPTPASSTPSKDPMTTTSSQVSDGAKSPTDLL